VVAVSLKKKNKKALYRYKNNDRSFVARGNEVGVFKMEEDGGLEYQTSLSIKTPSGALFTPSKVFVFTPKNC